MVEWLAETIVPAALPQIAEHRYETANSRADVERDVLDILMNKRDAVIRETGSEAIRLARTLVRTAHFGALATLDPISGAPLASRVAVATDLDGCPVILVSELSEHTGALLADGRCSLLLGEPGPGDPLAYPRIGLHCQAEQLQRETADQVRAARRYLNRHPAAKLYAGFGDFWFFRLRPSGASLNGGFGKAYRLTRLDLTPDLAANAELASTEQQAIDHMNADHSEAVDICARAFAGADGTGWTMTGLDAEGFDLARGDERLRVFFPAPLAGADQLRSALVDLVRSGRALLAGTG